MTAQLPEEQVDGAIRRFLVWQADDIAHAPTAADMAARIQRSAGVRSVAARLAHLTDWQDVFPNRSIVLIALVALTVVALVGSMVVGTLLNEKRPAIVPPPPSQVSTTPGPSASPPPSSTPVVTARPSPSTVITGTAATAIGQLSWTRSTGDSTSIPAGGIFETPDGFAAFEGEGGCCHYDRLWTSADGLEWELGPLPVAAAGAVGHRLAGGEHWIWSYDEFRVWRSGDFATWTEIDISALRPPAISGVEWEMWPDSLATVGPTTLLPWRYSGRLALAQLLGIPLEPGQVLSLEQRQDGEPAVVGDVRDVVRYRRATRRADEGPRVTVGSIRVTVEGSMVTITDLGRGVVVATIDSDVVGLPAAYLADHINWYGSFPDVRGGAVISNGNAGPLSYPLAPVTGESDRAALEFSHLSAIDGRFVALTDEPPAQRVWTTTDGLDWESLGSPILPQGTEAEAYLDVLDRPGGGPGMPLIAVAEINETETVQRQELWSSVDGVTWLHVGEGRRYGRHMLNISHSPTGGYLGIAENYQLNVSPDGTAWTIVEGVSGPGSIVDLHGGSVGVSVTHKAAFIHEVPNRGDRVIWMLRIEPAGR